MKNKALNNKHIEIILKETRTEFDLMTSAGENPNMDYAAYAADFSIHSFRSALQNPELSRRKLASILRRAYNKKQKKRGNRDYWNIYMAKTIRKIANSNEAAA